MGDVFVEPERLQDFRIDDEPYVGVEFVIRANLGVGTMRRLEQLVERPTDEETGEDKVARYDELCALFGDELLRSWNLADGRGRPRPADAKGCAAIDPALLGTMVSLVVLWIRGVPNPLSSGSAGGKPSSPPATKTPRRAKRSTRKRAR